MLVHLEYYIFLVLNIFWAFIELKRIYNLIIRLHYIDSASIHAILQK